MKAEKRRRRYHPALLTLILALRFGLWRLARPRFIVEAYAMLGFKVTERTVRVHRRWLIENGYIRVIRRKQGGRVVYEEVALEEKGWELVEKLGLALPSLKRQAQDPENPDGDRG